MEIIDDRAGTGAANSAGTWFSQTIFHVLLTLLPNLTVHTLVATYAPSISGKVRNLDWGMTFDASLNSPVGGKSKLARPKVCKTAHVLHAKCYKLDAFRESISTKAASHGQTQGKNRFEVATKQKVGWNIQDSSNSQGVEVLSALRDCSKIWTQSVRV